MTLAIYLDKTYLADVATISGWGDFVRWAEALDDDYPLIKELADAGCTESPVELLAELKAVDTPDDADTADVLAGIVESLEASDLEGAAVVIVSDGFGDDSDSDDESDEG